MTSILIDSDQSKINEQVTNGVAVRMAPVSSSREDENWAAYKSGTIVTKDRTEVNKDILIEDGRISRIGEGITDAADQVIDAGGLAVLRAGGRPLPSEDPGYEYKGIS